MVRTRTRARREGTMLIRNIADVSHEPMDVPGGPTVAQMADPEGNVIGLVKQ